MDARPNNPKSVKPSFCQIWLLRDDDLSDRVVDIVLRDCFHITHKEANEMIADFASTKRILCGIYTKEVAETKIEEASSRAAAHNRALNFQIKNGISHVIKKS